MKKITAPLLIISTILLNLLAGCDGLDENYSTNPNHRLSFSTDTLSFDTVLQQSVQPQNNSWFTTEMTNL